MEFPREIYLSLSWSIRYPISFIIPFGITVVTIGILYSRYGVYAYESAFKHGAEKYEEVKDRTVLRHDPKSILSNRTIHNAVEEEDESF